MIGKPGRKALFGMVHLSALPGTPFGGGTALRIVTAAAVADAAVLAQAGFDGCLIQTVDRVYPHDPAGDPGGDHARTAQMAVIADAVRREVPEDFAVGVQIMKNAVLPSLAAANAAGAAFVRASVLVGETMTPGGRVSGDPHAVMAYRKQIGAEEVGIIADIGSQHFLAGAKDAEIGTLARWARQAGAAAVCLGEPDEAGSFAMIEAVKRAAPDMPVILCGYTNKDNAARLLAAADGAFVGSCLKPSWADPIERGRAEDYVAAARGGEDG